MAPEEKESASSDRELLALVHELQISRCHLKSASFSVSTDDQVVSHFLQRKFSVEESLGGLKL